MLYHFADFELDLATFRLRCEGRAVKVDPKAFDLLHYLIQHRDRVVSKEELLERLWAGERVVDCVVPTTMGRLRRALGQTGAEREPIETVRGRGYRFASELKIVPRAAQAGRSVPRELDTDLYPALREPFVARERLLERLLSALDRARDGRVQVRLLSGGSGMGKSRLLEELSRRAGLSGVTAWLGRTRRGDTPPLWAWTTIVRQRLTGVLPHELSRLDAELRRQLAPMAPELAPTAGAAERLGDPDQAFACAAAVARLMRLSADRQPRLIMLDDLQHADRATLEVLLLLAEEPGDAQLLVVGTVDETGLADDHPTRALLARLSPLKHVKRLALEPLQPASVADYIAAHTGEAVSPLLAERIAARSGGNPWLVRELVRAAGVEALGHPEAEALLLPLPETAREGLRQRLRVLEPPTRRLLRAASVLGDELEVTLLRHVSGLPSESLLDELDRAQAAGILSADAAQRTRLSFAVPALRETLYDDLSASDRSRFHLRAAEALEGRSALTPATAEELAFHYHRALPHTHVHKVLEYTTQAAEQAEGRRAFEQAATLYRQALDAMSFVSQFDESRGGELLLSLGRAHAAAGRVEEARQTLEQVLVLADRLDDGGQLASQARALLSSATPA